MIERGNKRYVSCPVCGKMLMKCQGSCNIEIVCTTCRKEIVVLADDEKIVVLQNRRGVGSTRSTGDVRVSTPMRKPQNINYNTARKASNY